MFQSLGRDSGCSSLPRSHDAHGHGVFQSLGRDSGCSSRQLWRVTGTRWSVSIPRSGFWVFKHEPPSSAMSDTSVSIPRSGFWVFKLCDLCLAVICYSSFNPSVGILGVQA